MRANHRNECGLLFTPARLKRSELNLPLCLRIFGTVFLKDADRRRTRGVA